MTGKGINFDKNKKLWKPVIAPRPEGKQRFEENYHMLKITWCIAHINSLKVLLISVGSYHFYCKNDEIVYLFTRS